MMKANITLGHHVSGDLENDKNQNSETVLWVQFTEGDTVAFHALYSRHVSDLLSYGIRLIGDADLVKDTIQDLFLDLWENRKSYTKVKKVRPYLFTILRRNIFNQAKQHGKFLSLVDSAPQSNTSVSPEDEIIVEEHSYLRNNQVQKAIQKLNKRQQELIHLRYYVQLSNREIAKITGLPYQKVTYGIRTALQILESVLGNKELYLLFVHSFKSAI
ncbi:sigma-70 family RNA polymerase sigma factor [Sinomicrobium pectinilyticum]|uniref:Sigma-70 family RNA polymerase sigma factor n=1 Tax=Sinomicrobium pectinilyticum TaxID=1084421 RepID=A0A3N0EQC5_SINP1|nr:sigma-70 family RNA polymerase sigma factor [Sinomicrobium pectinilyticum]RNL90105.1 sigma-70 family RNA polymerase sigma factor [Sinomicrobium pectinilyticum]